MQITTDQHILLSSATITKNLKRNNFKQSNMKNRYWKLKEVIEIKNGEAKCAVYGYSTDENGFEVDYFEGITHIDTDDLTTNVFNDVDVRDNYVIDEADVFEIVQKIEATTYDNAMERAAEDEAETGRTEASTVQRKLAHKRMMQQQMKEDNEN